MNLRDILAVSGMPGLYKLASNRSNGLLVKDLITGKTTFCSMRKHQFTPMETVAIYTDSDTIELSNVFNRMMEQFDDNPPVSPKASKEEIVEYFTDIVPDYDRDRVYVSDMKKVIKWYSILDKEGYLTADPNDRDEEE